MRTTHKSRLHLKIAAITSCCLAILLLACGCVPYLELKQESIVEGMGIDSNGTGGYTLTFQIFKPKSGGGGSDSGKKSSSSEETILTSSGRTLNDAIRNATLQIGRKLYFSNNRAYIVGEDVCKNDIKNIIDFMERNEQFVPREKLYVAKGSASDILTYKKDGEIVPATNLEAMSDNYFQTSKMIDSHLFDTFRNVSYGITQPAIAAVALQSGTDGDTVLVIQGTAYFYNNRLAGYLDEKQTRGFLWIEGKVKSGIIALSLPDGGRASAEIIRSSGSVKTQAKNGKPSITVDITAQTNVTELETNNSVTVDSNYVDKLTAIQNSVIKNEAQSAIQAALHQNSSDIFGFGLSVYENEPELWKKIGNNWPKQLKNLDVQINVDSKILHTGLISKSN